MTLDKGYAVLIIFLSVWAVLFVYAQMASPRLIRRKFSRELASRGWIAVDADRAPAWNDIMTLAVNGNLEAASVREYDSKYGPLAIHAQISEKRAGKTLEVYRDAGTARHRYAAVGKKIEDIVSRRSPLLLASQGKHQYTGLEVWIGEARRIPVERPEMVFSGFAAMFGSAARKQAGKRDIDPEAIPAFASPSEVKPVQALREILLENSFAADVLAEVYIGRRSWVMTLPLKRLGSRTGELLDTAMKISEAGDRISASPAV
ncbi:MAG TPA: hypothetical protein DDY20_08155 [Desulfobulbaceae bacterium]|jgi:hypothetical protein|nr:hypothetical protein [Desulfobulbaceae bacterium]